jgi:hypothetical protein
MRPRRTASRLQEALDRIRALKAAAARS